MTKKAVSRLRRRMIEDMTICGLADKTQKGYIQLFRLAISQMACGRLS